VGPRRLSWNLSEGSFDPFLLGADMTQVKAECVTVTHTLTPSMTPTSTKTSTTTWTPTKTQTPIITWCVDSVTGTAGLQDDPPDSFCSCSVTQTYGLAAWIAAPSNLTGMWYIGNSAGDVMKLGIYDRDPITNYPATLLSQSSPITIVTPSYHTWVHVDMPPVSISAPQTVWLAITDSGSPDGTPNFMIAPSYSFPAIMGAGNFPEPFAFYNGVPSLTAFITPKLLVDWVCP